MNAQVRPSTIEPANARPLDMKLEIAVIPVSDVDRAKQFYSNLGWRLDAENSNENCPRSEFAIRWRPHARKENGPAAVSRLATIPKTRTGR